MNFVLINAVFTRLHQKSILYCSFQYNKKIRKSKKINLVSHTPPFFSYNNPDNALGILDPNANEEEHLKYFGSTLIDMLWDDPTDTETKTDYSSRIFEHCRYSYSITN